MKKEEAIGPTALVQGDFTQRDFRDAMGHFATGVVVVSTANDGHPYAMTASAFMSGSLDPFLVVVSIAKTARMHERLRKARCYGISVLTQSQEWISNHFAGRRPSNHGPRFDDLGGIPVIPDAPVRLAADLRQEHLCGDHTLFVGEVRAMELNRELARPLLYYRGRYHQVSPDSWTLAAMSHISQHEDHAPHRTEW
jgi:flavin reductase